MKLKKFCNVVNQICLKIIYLICKRNQKNVKSCQKLICKERENSSLGSISSPILICLRFCHKDHNQLQFKKTSKSCLMPLRKQNLENQTKKVAAIKLLLQSFKSLEDHKKYPWLHMLNVREIFNLGLNLSKKKCKKP